MADPIEAIDPNDPLSALRTVAQRGAPAQADEARRLIALDAEGVDVASDAARLWDAYLNDPYLERF